MKSLTAILFLLFFSDLHAQTTFHVQHDTVFAAPAVGAGIIVEDGISAATDTVNIVWSVVASDFPADWIANNAICDNKACYFLTSLWSAASGTLSVNTSRTYGVAHLDTPGGDFHMLAGFADTNTTGCHFLTVRMDNLLVPSDTATETYILCNYPLGAPAAVKPASDMTLYPNPAHNTLHVLTGGIINCITVYNTIGDICAIIQTTTSNPCIDVSRLPAGFYLVRATGTDGTVTTLKFLKQ